MTWRRAILILIAGLLIGGIVAATTANAGGYGSSSYRSSSYSSSSRSSSYSSRTSKPSYSSRSSSTSSRTSSTKPSPPKYANKPSAPKTAYGKTVTVTKAPGGGFAPKVKVPTTIKRYPVRPTSGEYVHVYDLHSHLWVWIAYSQAYNHGWAPQGAGGGVDATGVWILLGIFGAVFLVGIIYLSRRWWIGQVT